MANYRGEEGSVKFKNSAGTAEAVVQTTSWTLDLAKEVLETTVQGDTARTYVGGLISGSGSIEFNYTAASGNETKNLIDDVLATGGTALAAIELINKFKNKNIIGAGFIINLPDLKGEKKLLDKNIKTHSLMEF